jgi:hypothetical protein
MLNLTDLAIRSLKAPDKGQKDYFDGAMPGFGVRISQGGTRSFFFFYRQQEKPPLLGTRELTVGEIAERFNVARSTIYNHP